MQVYDADYIVNPIRVAVNAQLLLLIDLNFVNTKEHEGREVFALAIANRQQCLHRCFLQVIRF